VDAVLVYRIEADIRNNRRDLQQVRGDLKEVGNTAEQTGRQVQSALRVNPEQLRQALRETRSGLIESAKGAAEFAANIAHVLGGVETAIRLYNQLQTNFGGIGGFLSTTGQQIVQLYGRARDAIVQFAEAVGQRLSSALGQASGAMGSMLSGAAGLAVGIGGIILVAVAAAAAIGGIIAVVGVAAVAFSALSSVVDYLVDGFKRFAETGIGFLRTVEDATVAIGALIASNLQLSNPSINPGQALAQGLAIAREQARALRVEALKTNVEFDGLLKTYQAGLGPGQAAGLDPTKIRKLSSLIGQAGKAMLVPEQGLPQEINALLSGDIDQNAKIAKTLGITGKEIKKLIEQTKKDGRALFDFLEKKLAAYAQAGILAANTLTGVLSNVQDVLKNVSAEAFVKTFEEIKKQALDGLKIVVNLDTGEVNKDLYPLLSLIDEVSQIVVQQLGAALQLILNGVVDLSRWLGQNRGLVEEILAFFRAIGGDVLKNIRYVLQSVNGDSQSWVQTIAMVLRFLRFIVDAIGTSIAVAIVAVIKTTRFLGEAWRTIFSYAERIDRAIAGWLSAIARVIPGAQLLANIFIDAANAFSFLQGFGLGPGPNQSIGEALGIQRETTDTKTTAANYNEALKARGRGGAGGGGGGKGGGGGSQNKVAEELKQILEATRQLNVQTKEQEIQVKILAGEYGKITDAQRDQLLLAGRQFDATKRFLDEQKARTEAADDLAKKIQESLKFGDGEKTFVEQVDEAFKGLNLTLAENYTLLVKRNELIEKARQADAEKATRDYEARFKSVSDDLIKQNEELSIQIALLEARNDVEAAAIKFKLQFGKLTEGLNDQDKAVVQSQIDIYLQQLEQFGILKKAKAEQEALDNQALEAAKRRSEQYRAIAEQGTLNLQRVQDGLLDYFSRQKGVTEAVLDFQIGAVEAVYSRLDSKLSGLTKKLGLFGDVIKNFLLTLIKASLNKVFMRLFGLDGGTGGGGLSIPGFGGGGFGAPAQAGGGLFGGIGSIFSGRGLGQAGATPGFAGPMGGFGGGGGILGGFGFPGLGTLTGTPGFNGGDPLATLTGQARSAAGSIVGNAAGLAGGSGLSVGAFGGRFAGLAGLGPLLGLSLGSRVGGFLGGAGGLLLGSAAFAGLAGSAGIAGLLTGFGVSAGSAAGIAGAAAAFLTNPFTIIAGVGLLIGGWLIGRAKQRKRDERERDRILGDVMKQLDELLKGVKNLSIDGASAVEQATSIRSQYVQAIGQLKTESVRKSAIRNQLPQVDRKIDEIKAAAEAQAARKQFAEKLIPEFAGGGAMELAARHLGRVTMGRGWPYDDVIAKVSRNEAVVNPVHINRIGEMVMAAVGVPGFQSRGGFVAPTPATSTSGPAFGDVYFMISPDRVSKLVVMGLDGDVAEERVIEIFTEARQDGRISR
jgi:hypothetical protein